MLISVRPVSVQEVFDNEGFGALISEYRDEALRNPDLMGSMPDRKAYEAMVESGILTPIAAFVDGVLAGLCSVISVTIPHFTAKRIASTESLFVASAYRSSGAGMQLIKAAERVAVERGARGLYITAPVGGRLNKILPNVGYGHTNTIYYRGLA